MARGCATYNTTVIAISRVVLFPSVRTAVMVSFVSPGGRGSDGNFISKWNFPGAIFGTATENALTRAVTDAALLDVTTSPVTLSPGWTMFEDSRTETIRTGSVSDAYGTPFGRGVATLVTPRAGTPRTIGIVTFRGSAPAAVAGLVTPLAGTLRIFGIITLRNSAPAALAASDAPLCGATRPVDATVEGSLTGVLTAAATGWLCDAPQLVRTIVAPRSIARIFIYITVRAERRPFRPSKHRRASAVAREYRSS